MRSFMLLILGAAFVPLASTAPLTTETALLVATQDTACPTSTRVCEKGIDGSFLNSQGHNCEAIRKYANGGQADWTDKYGVKAGDVCIQFCESAKKDTCTAQLAELNAEVAKLKAEKMKVMCAEMCKVFQKMDNAAHTTWGNGGSVDRGFVEKEKQKHFKKMIGAGCATERDHRWEACEKWG